MSVDPNLLQKLEDAEDSRQVVLTRHLCEEILAAAPNDFCTLISYAECLINFSLYDEAAKVLDRAAVRRNKRCRQLVLLHRGHLLKRMGDFSGAEAMYLSAHELMPREAGCLIFAACAARARGNIEGAEELARRAILCPEGCLDEAYHNLGGYLIVQRKYDEARICYLRALEIDPDYSFAKRRLEDLDLFMAHWG